MQTRSLYPLLRGLKAWSLFPLRWGVKTITNARKSLVCFVYFIYLFGVLRRFQHCTGHITTGSWKGRGNQYIQFVRVLYCKLPTDGKQLPTFPLEAVLRIKPRPQRWEEARVLPLCHRGPCLFCLQISSYAYIRSVYCFT